MRAGSSTTITKRWRARWTQSSKRAAEDFIEDLSILIDSGMSIVEALHILEAELRHGKMREKVREMQEAIASGASLWDTLKKTGEFSAHTVSLVRLGEESGRLVENLRIVALQQEKNRLLRAKIRSAMMYPIFVFSLSCIIATGIAWFLLPKIATIFTQLQTEPPLITRLLIQTGEFFGKYNAYIIFLALLCVSALFYTIFHVPRMKIITQSFLFALPGTKRLFQEIELAQFGYLLGTLLDAGLPITDSLQSLTRMAFFFRYKKFYAYLTEKVEEGNSFQHSFTSYDADMQLLMPITVQRMIIASEKAGSLSKILLKIGQRYESKVDTTTKNLVMILEPLLLVVVWLAVVTVALAVILPIYNLIGHLNTL